MGAQGSSGQNFPLDNLTYDLVTILYEKSKGLEAMDKYMRDAQGHQEIGQLIQRIRQQDEQIVQQLQQHLSQLLSNQGNLSSRAVGGGTMGGGSMGGGSMGGSMSGSSGGSMGGGTMGGGSMTDRSGSGGSNS
jgi:TolA-binding protein